MKLRMMIPLLFLALLIPGLTCAQTPAEPIGKKARHAFESIYGKSSLLANPRGIPTRKPIKQLTLEEKKLLSDYVFSVMEAHLKFDTLVFKADKQSNVTDLYRFNILVKEGDLTQKRILGSISLAQSWLLNNIDPKTNLQEYNRQRVDYIQHSVMALIKAYQNRIFDR